MNRIDGIDEQIKRLYADGVTQHQMAERIGIPRGTISTHIRAMARRGEIELHYTKPKPEQTTAQLDRDAARARARMTPRPVPCLPERPWRLGLDNERWPLWMLGV